MAVTLLERVQRTAAPERPERRPVQNVEDLREAVQRYVPSEVVAALLEEDPFRARNELRSACRQVFAEPAWAAVGAERRDSLTQELVAVVFGMGPLEPLLADESITEITVNKGGAVWVERDGVMRPTEASFASDAQVRGLIDRILGPLGRRIDESSPSVSARLPQGHRCTPWCHRCRPMGRCWPFASSPAKCSRFRSWWKRARSNRRRRSSFTGRWPAAKASRCWAARAAAKPRC